MLLYLQQIYAKKQDDRKNKKQNTIQVLILPLKITIASWRQALVKYYRYMTYNSVIRRIGKIALISFMR